MSAHPHVWTVAAVMMSEGYWKPTGRVMCAQCGAVQESPQVSLLVPALPDPCLTEHDLANLPEMRVELLGGDLYIGGQSYGHGARARALLHLLKTP